MDEPGALKKGDLPSDSCGTRRFITFRTHIRPTSKKLGLIFISRIARIHLETRRMTRNIWD
jgi:hypothetical protein